MRNIELWHKGSIYGQIVIEWIDLLFLRNRNIQMHVLNEVIVFFYNHIMNCYVAVILFVKCWDFTWIINTIPIHNFSGK